MAFRSLGIGNASEVAVAVIDEPQAAPVRPHFRPELAPEVRKIAVVRADLNPLAIRAEVIQSASRAHESLLSESALRVTPFTVAGRGGWPVCDGDPFDGLPAAASANPFESFARTGRPDARRLASLEPFVATVATFCPVVSSPATEYNKHCARILTSSYQELQFGFEQSEPHSNCFHRAPQPNRLLIGQ